MNRVTLQNGFQIPQVGFGTFPLKGEDLKVPLLEACRMGYELVDTAIGYGNEDVVGDVLSGKDNTLISTKIDAISLRRMLLPDFLKRIARFSTFDTFIKRQIIKDAIEMSFARLNRVDIMLLHAPYHGCIKVYEEISRQYGMGRIKAYGVSNFNIEELKQLHNICGEWPMINQTEISPVNSQKELVVFCQEHGIVVEAYSPFGRGKLVQEFMEDKMLQEIAGAYGKTVGQVILRWIVQQGMVAIVRSSNPQRIRGNIELFDFELNKSEMAQIDGMNKNKVFGANQIGKNTIKL